MRHRDSSREPSVSAREIVPAAPLLPDSPILRWLLVLPLCGIALLASGSPAAAEDTRLVFNVARPHGEHDLLQAVFQESTLRGVSMPAAAAVIRRLNSYIDGRTESGKPATVCVGMSVNLLVAAETAKWSADDASRLILQLQAELDADVRLALEHSRRVIAMIEKGDTPDHVLGKTLQAAP